MKEESKMRKVPISLGKAIALLVVSILLGSVFTFGMQHWNAEVTQESCTLVETQFVSYQEIHQPKRPLHIKEIVIYCANGEQYNIDGVSINTQLKDALSALSEQENISLLIHPNSNTIVEFSTENGNILDFNKTTRKLGRESTGFLFLGFFLYFCALVGLYYVVLNCIHKRKAKCT
ncbi:MAG: hypothetical protein IJZ48_00895 [Oscillospiraceae bacterium]|nr:hypothetical protein [Oscillospiraceae bacterium]